MLTGELNGYYADYQTPRMDLARALASGFIYQGEISEFWGKKPRGEPSGELPPATFVNFLQNHDQIGNRPLGDRLESLVSPKQIEAAIAVTLLAPMIPMLFQGEEWGSTAPFPFFCDFQGGLADAVRKGRRQEYAWAYEKYGDDVPDPFDPATLQSAVLDWTSRAPEQEARLTLVRNLLAVRRKEIAPRLKGASFGDAAAADNGLLTAHWRMGDGATLRLTANLSDKDITQSGNNAGAPIWGDAAADRLPPWSVVWHLGG
jgi:maltooligosyltrehalose trehalohydrolase